METVRTSGAWRIVSDHSASSLDGIKQFSAGESESRTVWGEPCDQNQAARDVGAARERFEAWVKGSTFATGVLRTRFIPP